ncbi:MAG: ABC transporter ATP-binding protein [Euryarchaeota archaeon]|nr:ABC transporter ATP-binding protein [Euryarchaeota archaeon]
MVAAVEVQSLTRSFSGKEDIIALNNVDLRVEEGELFGLLGPNGAGKTTLIKILCTLLLPSSGTARVLGYDVDREAHLIRPRINMVSGGEISGYGLLTVRENLWMFSQFYGVPGKVAKERIDELLNIFDLADKADAKLRTISTGQRQKMNVIRGFVTNPDLIFLDEPTLGLDVTSSRTIRDYVRRWIGERDGRTILLTTHYMREAEELCDRVAIIDRGKVLACDTPSNLKRSVDDSSSFLIETTPFDVSPLHALRDVRGMSVEACDGYQILRVGLEDESVISDIISQIITCGAKVIGLNKTETTLEDVFIQMVGRGLE